MGESAMSLNSAGAVDSIARVRGRIGHYRWVICALIFAATVINYIDRQMIGVLKPTLQQEFGWTEVTYGDIVFWFQAAYAVGFVAFGRLMDRGIRPFFRQPQITTTLLRKLRPSLPFMTVKE